VSIIRLIDSLCKEFEATARQRNLSIEQHTRARNVITHGDAKRLWQVFAILLDNAPRHSKSGGTVEVSVSMDSTTNIVDVYIGKLRKKIDLGEDEYLIETVRGLGFRLNLPPGTRKRPAKMRAS
jgi:signal transduction histidine kinase